MLTNPRKIYPMCITDEFASVASSSFCAIVTSPMNKRFPSNSTISKCCTHTALCPSGSIGIAIGTGRALEDPMFRGVLHTA